jgi:hypothetical protein
MSRKGKGHPVNHFDVAITHYNELVTELEFVVEHDENYSTAVMEDDCDKLYRECLVAMLGCSDLVLRIMKVIQHVDGRGNV